MDTLLAAVAHHVISTIAINLNRQLKRTLMITKKNLTILLIGIVLITAIITILVIKPASPGLKKTGTSSLYKEPVFTVKTFHQDSSWGYKIRVDTTLLIYQEFIPGLPGHIRFTSEKDALRCGELVCFKLRHRKNPSISVKELDSLQIDYPQIK